MAWMVYGLNLAGFLGTWWAFLIVAANAFHSRPVNHYSVVTTLF